MTRSPGRTGVTSDLFCRVVDNLGDIGVCWRLARQLWSEHGWSVRVIVDDLRSFAVIAPEVQAIDHQVVDGIRIAEWNGRLDLVPAQVVIETFACDPPAAYVEAMARQPAPPVWLNLEYLAVEDWALGCQWMASPHPRLPLVKHFVFPGIEGDLAVLREHDLPARQALALADPGWRRSRLRALGADPEAAMTLFVFSYPSPALDALCEALVSSPVTVQCLLAPSAATRHLRAGREGALRLVPLEPVTQVQFDEWLWLADLTIVRGEDSFVRAQLAGAPFVWQAYPQSGEAHWNKLHGFAARYTASVTEPAASLWWDLQEAWNRAEPSPSAWEVLWRRVLQHRDELTAMSTRWQRRLHGRPDLAGQIVGFCTARL